jgi:hypothetical protein
MMLSDGTSNLQSEANNLVSFINHIFSCSFYLSYCSRFLTAVVFYSLQTSGGFLMSPVLQKLTGPLLS